MPLTDVQIRNAKPQDKPYKLTDGGGLYLLIHPSGGKRWRWKYYIHGKEKLLAIGVYPDVTIAEARKKRDEARELLKDGLDPSQQKQIDKLTSKAKAGNSFETVAKEWHAKYSRTVEAGTAARNLRILELNVFPWLGDRPIADINAPELLAVLRRMESRGILETAHRTRALASKVFRYGIATGRCERDAAEDVKGSLTPCQTENLAAIVDPLKFGQLLRDIWAYQGNFATCVAFRLSALFGLRPGELRKLEWAEVDTGENALIRIPMGKMKKRRVHVVPLSQQAIALLDELRPLTGHGKYCFPGMKDHARPMSENTINAALRRLGYDTQEEQCAHGFRSSFSTLANDSALWRKEVVEVQLAHKHGNEVELTYNRGDYLKERRRLMQWWSDECDRMRTGAEVIPLKTAS
jgi:integrase